MIKRHFWEILLVVLLSMNTLYGKPEVVDWRVLSDTSSKRAELFVDKDNKVFVDVRVSDILWLNNKWVKTDQYGDFVDGFTKDGCVHLAFLKDKQHLDIYSVGKDIVLENSVTIGDFLKLSFITKVIYVPGENKDACYLLGSRTQLPQDPVERMKTILSGGHGLSYGKPILAEIQDRTLLEYFKVPYGGKTDESYRVKEVLTGKDTIHFLGFRTQRQLGSGYRGSVPDVLYYAEYNTEKRKVVQTHDIYEKLHRRSFHWHVSADNFNDEVSIVFSWHELRDASNIERNIVATHIENVNTPIYYSQSGGKTFSDTEVIGEGILPLVRADSLGNVHIIWANSNGDLVHRVKKGDKWSDEQIISDGVIDPDYVWEQTYQGTSRFKKMSAEFDKDNNLNVVFTSKGKLVYAKIRVD